MAGLFQTNPAVFLDMDGNTIRYYMKGVNEARTNELVEKDYLNYILGQYTSFAYNAPKRYPDKPFLNNMQAKETHKPLSADDQMLALKMWMVRMGAEEVEYE